MIQSDKRFKASMIIASSRPERLLASIQMIEQAGYLPITTSTISETIAKAQQYLPCLILTEAKLLDGEWNLLEKQIHAQPELKNTRMIVYGTVLSGEKSLRKQTLFSQQALTNIVSKIQKITPSDTYLVKLDAPQQGHIDLQCRALFYDDRYLIIEMPMIDPLVSKVWLKLPQKPIDGIFIKLAVRLSPTRAIFAVPLTKLKGQTENILQQLRYIQTPSHKGKIVVRFVRDESMQNHDAFIHQLVEANDCQFEASLYDPNTRSSGSDQVESINIVALNEQNTATWISKNQSDRVKLNFLMTRYHQTPSHIETILPQHLIDILPIINQRQAILQALEAHKDLSKNFVPLLSRHTFVQSSFDEVHWVGHTSCALAPLSQGLLENNLALDLFHQPTEFVVSADINSHNGLCKLSLSNVVPHERGRIHKTLSKKLLMKNDDTSDQVRKSA
jgi:hypothetical protein